MSAEGRTASPPSGRASPAESESGQPGAPKVRYVASRYLAAPQKAAPQKAAAPPGKRSLSPPKRPNAKPLASAPDPANRSALPAPRPPQPGRAHADAGRGARPAVAAKSGVVPRPLPSTRPPERPVAPRPGPSAGPTAGPATGPSSASWSRHAAISGRPSAGRSLLLPSSAAGTAPCSPEPALTSASPSPAPPASLPAPASARPRAPLPPVSDEQVYLAHIRLLQWRLLAVRAQKAYAEQRASAERQLLAAAELLREELDRAHALRMRVEEGRRQAGTAAVLLQQIEALKKLRPLFERLAPLHEQLASAAHSRGVRHPIPGLIVPSVDALVAKLKQANVLLGSLVGECGDEDPAKAPSLEKLRQLAALLSEMRKMAADTLDTVSTFPDELKQLDEAVAQAQ
ncbi:hypothetical protein DFJ74DRAFT_772516 [Hyaloraphidium curvatum]|nr:hypothetical protein DFJ74DRAFT_772516 [Hyaloraphidium curvatum]